MSIVANIVVALIGLLHAYILVLEMFLWDKPAGLRAFENSLEVATATKVTGFWRRVCFGACSLAVKMCKCFSCSACLWLVFTVV
jgi:uncharacterized membrane protein